MDSVNNTQCYAKIWYSCCCVVCTMGQSTHLVCIQPGASMNFIQQCMTLNQTTMYMCPTLCDPTTARRANLPCPRAPCPSSFAMG